MHTCSYALLGPTEQRLSGSAVVQFATREGEPASAQYALAFYIRRPAFDRFAALSVHPVISRMCWYIQEVIPNDWGQSNAGCTFPPCLVMRRGEALEQWAMRVQPNLPTALNALVQIAELVRELHVAGYMYRALKPSNVAWFVEEKQWALIDFKCTVKQGRPLAVVTCFAHFVPLTVLALCIHQTARVSCQLHVARSICTERSRVMSRGSRRRRNGH
jgi:hypothetical protein